MKKLLYHFPHYAMKTNHLLPHYVPRNTVLFGKYILSPLDKTAAKSYLLLILYWDMQDLFHQERLIHVALLKMTLHV